MKALHQSRSLKSWKRIVDAIPSQDIQEATCYNRRYLSMPADKTLLLPY